jgi:hypothetical protein
VIDPYEIWLHAAANDCRARRMPGSRE